MVQTQDERRMNLANVAAQQLKGDSKSVSGGGIASPLHDDDGVHMQRGSSYEDQAGSQIAANQHGNHNRSHRQLCPLQMLTDTHAKTAELLQGKLLTASEWQHTVNSATHQQAGA